MFSPKSVSPAAAAARTRASDWRFAAPTRMTSSGCLPAREHALEIRSRIEARRPATPVFMGVGASTAGRAASSLGLGDVKNALAAVAQNQSSAVGNLDYGLRPHSIVAGSAVPDLDAALAGLLHLLNRGGGVAVVPVEDSPEVSQHVGGQGLLELLDLALHTFGLLGDIGLFGFPLLQRLRVAGVEIGEGLLSFVSRFQPIPIADLKR